MHDIPTAHADTIGGPGAASPGTTLEFARGTLINRYVILERLGAGGMGVVFAAYDPELRRRVALKFLHLDGANDETRQARLLREAQSLARLSHPNVINVFDAGTHEGRVYVTMEYIEGQTLRQWCDAEERPWREVLSLYIEAAHGLAAAHEAGLIHRDFKPENVLLDKNGRARVLDFGLARQVHPPGQGHVLQSQDTLVGRGRDAMAAHLTRPGAMAGTPLYMAPEQLLHGSANESSDQYSFCVSLYEAVYRQRPFKGETIAELIYNATTVAADPRPPRSLAPKQLARALTKGLAKDPSQRFASMKDVIARLESIRATRTYLPLFGAAALLCVAAASFHALNRPTHLEPELCTSSSAALQGIWDEARQAHLKDAMERTGAPFAKEAWFRVSESLNEYTHSWVSLHTETCRKTHIQGTQSSALLDLRMECFERRLAELRALVDVLENADAIAVARATEGTAKLITPDRCTATTDLDEIALYRSAPEEVAASQAVWSQISKSTALRNTAQFAAALDTASVAVESSRKLSDPSLLAEALLEKGRALEEIGDYAAARETISAAYYKSIESGNDIAAATCAFYLITQNLGLEPARQWIPHAQAFINRFERRDHPLARQMAANLFSILGTVAVADEEYSTAEEHYKSSLDIYSSLVPADEISAGAAHNNLGNLLLRRGDTEGAREHIVASLQSYRRLLGPHHPQVGVALNNLGEIYMRAGRLTAADEAFAQSFSVFSATLEPKHPHLGVSHNNLGDLFQQTGQLTAAKGHYEAAVEIFAATFGEGAGASAYPLTGLGEVLLLQGDDLSAITALDKAMALPDIGDAALRGRMRFARARALALRPDRRAQVVELAKASRAAFVAAGPSYSRELAEVERWLASQHDSTGDASKFGGETERQGL